MRKIEIYECELCKRTYKNEKSAKFCELSHIDGKIVGTRYTYSRIVPTQVSIKIAGEEFKYELSGDYVTKKISKIDTLAENIIKECEENEVDENFREKLKQFSNMIYGIENSKEG